MELQNLTKEQMQALRKTDVSGSVTLTEKNVCEIGFVKHSDYTYKLFKNNVIGYLDEIEVFFEPNEAITVTVQQQTFNSDDLDKNLIFIRNMSYLSELKMLVNVLCGFDLTDR